MDMKQRWTEKSKIKDKTLKLWNSRLVATTLLRFAFCILIFAFLTCSAFACPVPVFRYAMERWAQDYYDAVIIHRGRIAEDDPAVSFLRSKMEEGLNLRLSEIDISSNTEDEAGPEPAEQVKSLLGGQIPEKLPAIALWYPWQRGQTPPVWLDEFTSSAMTALVQSPKRQELAKRLTKGQSAVWILLESGHADKDKAALQLLNQELETAARQLKEMSPSYVDDLEMPGLSYEFSTLTVSRSDPQERVLLALLLNSEPDLHEYVDEPIVFPVFGRGRVLYALVAEGINVDNIRETISFLVGPCGCEIKMMSPGVDLLMAVNWDAAVMQFYEEFYEIEEALPELTSVFPEEPADTNSSLVTRDSSIEPRAANDETRSLGLMGTTAVSLAAILLVVASVTLVVSRRKK